MQRSTTNRKPHRNLRLEAPSPRQLANHESRMRAIREDIEHGPRFRAFLETEGERIANAGKGQPFRPFNYTPWELFSVLAYRHSATQKTKQLYDGLTSDEHRIWEGVAERVWMELEALQQTWLPVLPAFPGGKTVIYKPNRWQRVRHFVFKPRSPVRRQAPTMSPRFEHYSHILTAYLPPEVQARMAA